VKPFRWFAILIVSGTVGCTHVQLRRDTVNLSQTLTELYVQQVLNNVARFVQDPGALPDFAYPNQGSTGVTDMGNGMFSVAWSNTGFSSAGLGGNASRQLSDSWTLAPVTDPRKLELMRCAYERAVASCFPGRQPEECIDCVKRWAEFYLGTASPHGKGPDGSASVEDIAQQVHAEIARRGIVGPDCLNGPCWFHVGCKKSVPKGCVYVGHDCDVYVWVCPGEGSQQLTDLTLTILDYAMHDAAALITKNVSLTTKTAAGDSVTVSATVAIDENLDAVADELKNGYLAKSTMLRRHTRPELSPTPGAFLLPLQQSLRALPPQ
jgi:hypothetical protein